MKAPRIHRTNPGFVFRPVSLVFACFLSLAAPLATCAAENQPPSGFIALFNGRDFASWKVPEGDNGHWKVINGVIDYDAESEGKGDKSLWTDREFGDFVLHVDWRIKETPYVNPNVFYILPDGTHGRDVKGKELRMALPDSDSGIFLRGAGKYQLNIWCWPIGSGEMYSVRMDARMPAEVRSAVTPRTQADKPIGEWNHFEITVRGNTVRVVLNGKTVLPAAQIPDLPSRGRIALQHHGSKKDGKWTSPPSLMQFKNIFIKELDTGETLYNGIVLPREWPPRLSDFPTSVEKDPAVPPYLISPPDVIPIELGRQLFVDDFLIAESTLKRTFHLAKYHAASPVLKPDKPWEMKNPDHAAAMVFSDGVWYDPKDQLFKMWYLVGESASTGYATSRDGIHWDKPSLDVRPPTNIVQPGGRDSSTVWLDLEEKDPARRFKMFRVIGAGEDPVTKWNNWQMAIHFSADGIHWGDPVAKSGRLVDRSTVFWNPFRQVWVYSVRHVYEIGGAVDRRYGFPRRRSYVEDPDVLAAARWEVNGPLRWTDVDRLDPQRDDLKIKPQLYNLDAIAYESLMVGFFTVWRGQPADRHKPNEVVLGYSRDGWHWSRPDRRAFCPVSDQQGDWNANNVQSAGGGFLVVGDELYFYVSGRTGRPGTNKAGTLTTGLATLRRDGFASMAAEAAGGTLTTRPVRFTGKHLFVNVEDPNGELRVEILDQAGQGLPRFAAENCLPVTTRKTLHAVRWNGVDDLSAVTNQPVRIRFHLKNGKLYSFWVSPEISGTSQGYVAAGGPGFSGNRDTGKLSR